MSEAIPAALFTSYHMVLGQLISQRSEDNQSITYDDIDKAIGRAAIIQTRLIKYSHRWDPDCCIAIDKHCVPIELNIEERRAYVDHAIDMVRPIMNTMSEFRRCDINTCIEEMGLSGDWISQLTIDPQSQHDSQIAKNKLGITNADELKKAERIFSSIRLGQLEPELEDDEREFLLRQFNENKTVDEMIQAAQSHWGWSI